MNIKVVSKRNLSSELGWADIYVGRPSALGNPFVMKTEGDRDWAVAQYRKWLWNQIQNPQSKAKAELFAIAKRVKANEQIRVVCWCKQPDREVACHGDIIVRAIEWLLSSGLV